MSTAMPSKDRLLALGLMSGTSCDGVDAALVETDGRSAIACGPWLSEPYDAAFHDRLRSVLGGRGDVAAVERELTERHAHAVRDLLAGQGIAPGNVDVIGFHGQTVLHEPERGRTWQIGDGPLLARLTGIDVVNDFRNADVAAGGQGAPFVPLFHAALAAALPRPLAVLNIGGVANVTWIGEEGVDGELIAFDTGPGNALLNDWTLRHTGRPADIGGALAASGRVDAGVLSVLLNNPYFGQPAPKSLDRDAFDPAPLERLSAADGAATLVAFTAASAAQAQKLFPAPGQSLAGRRRRPPQPNDHGRAGTAPGRGCCAGGGRGVGRRCPGGAGLRLSSRAVAARPAVERADDDRSQPPPHGRQAPSDLLRGSDLADGGLCPAGAHDRGEVVIDLGRHLLDAVVEEVVGALDDAVVDLDVALMRELLHQLVDRLLRDDVVAVALQHQAPRRGRAPGSRSRTCWRAATPR